MATTKKKKSALDDVNSGIIFPTILSKEMKQRIEDNKNDDIAPYVRKTPAETTSFLDDWAKKTEASLLEKEDDASLIASGILGNFREKRNAKKQEREYEYINNYVNGTKAKVGMTYGNGKTLTEKTLKKYATDYATSVDNLRVVQDSLTGENKIVSLKDYRTRDGLENMTADEIATYNKLYAQNPSDAEAYLDGMQVELSKRGSVKRLSEQKAKVTENGKAGAAVWSAMSVPMNVYGSVVNAAGQAVNKLTGKEYNPYTEGADILNRANVIRSTVNENLEDNKVGQMAYNATMSAADNMLNLANASVLGAGKIGTQILNSSTMGAATFGSTVKELKDQGVSDGKITATGLTRAGIEAALEAVSLDALLTPKAAKSVVGALVKGGMSQAVAEGGTEGLTELATTLTDRAILQEDSDTYQRKAELMEQGYSEEEAKKQVRKEVALRIAEAVGTGAMAGGAMGGVSNVVQHQTHYTENEKAVINAEVQKRISEQETGDKKLTKKEKSAIEEEVRSELEKGAISIDSIESALGGETYNSYKALSEEMDEYSTLNKTKAMELTGEQSDRLAELKEKNKQASYESEKARLKEQLSKEVDELTANDSFLRESYNEKSRKGQAYEADLTKYKSEAQKAIIQKAIDSKILNNTRRTHEFVDMISKIAADKGVSFDFTNNEKLKESGFAIDGATVNGYVQGNNISLNIQSAKSLNKIVGHEITHVLEGTELYSELQSVVKQYAETKGEYAARLEALEKLYEGVEDANIENELTADLIGDYLFTDEKFVNNLSAKNLNIFKKIYEEIKYLVKVATAGTKEAKELEKVKRIFEKAYKQKTDTTENVKFAFDSSEDAKMHTFIEKALAREIPDKYRYEISETISERLASDVEDIVGFSVRGYKNKITPGRIRHIINRHGEKGSGDNSLENTHDIAKMGYVIENYDKIAKGKELNAEFKNADDSHSKTIVLQKQIGDEYYYVVEAVPDSTAKTLFVTSAYINKNDTIAEAGIAQSLNPDVRNELQSDVSSDSIVPDSQENTTSLKEKQLEIVLKHNPMQDDYHTGIRSVDDILTFEEALNSDDYIDYKGEDFDKSYPYSIAEKALSTGKIMVYSSYPIEQGVFVSPSYMEAQMYSGNGQVYSKEVALTDIAWIDPTQGQMAAVEEKSGNGTKKYKKGTTLNELGQSQDISDSSTDIIPESQENTTENPDINMSLSQKGQQDIAPIGKYNVYGKDIALETPIRSDIPAQQTEDIAPVHSDIQKNNSEVRRGFKPLTEEQANARDKERMAAEFPPGISKIARNQIARELKEILPFAVSGQVKRVEEMIQRYVDAENPDGNALYMELKEEFASNTLKRRIEEVADVQAALRTTRIAVSDAVKNGITDFNTLRKSVFGKMQLAKDGLQVDEAYQELSIMYPNYFPEDIVNQADQFLRMVDVASQERYYNEEVTADGQSIARATNHIMDKVEEYKKSKEERERRKRESRAYLHATIIDNIKTKFAEKGLDFDDILKNAKNKSTFASVDNTPQRFIEKTFGYKEGQILNDLTMNQTALNESNGIKWLSSFTNRKNGVLAQIVKEYGIKPGSKASAAAQMFGEGFYVNDKNELIQYGENELMRDFPDAKVRENIRKLATDPRIRKIYDETLDKINESRTRNAYPEIPRRNDYFLHFRAMDDTFSRLGLPFNPNDIRAKDLPTDLNGVTADLKPGQPYFASANQRKGHKTTYDLLGGLEKYLTSAKNQIYHIDDIQTLRALRNYVANMFGQAHGLDNIDQMSEEEVEERIKDVFNSHLSTFSRFLTEEANVLAGKTSMIDRSIEGIFGRRAVTTLNTINKQVASNMIGFNLSSSLTNFVSVVQGFSKANKIDAVKAFAQVAANKVNSIYGRSDGFADQNPLIIRRKGADVFTRTPYQKIADKGFIFMSAIDDLSTEFIVRAKYNELTRKGMDEEQAHVESSKWAARILGDRSYGQQPLIFNSKTLGLFTKFQLEVRNQLDSMFYDTIQEAKLSTEDMQKGFQKNAVAAAKVTATVAQLAVFQHLFGKAFESIAGYNPTFDIISTIMTACGFDDKEDSEDTPLDNLEQAFLELMEDLPYTSTLTGGRIPIASALPIEQLITGTDDYGNEKPRWETALEALPYYLAPTGVNQAKKTMQGLAMFDDDLPIAGSYTKNTVIDKVKGDSPGNLRFSVEDTIPNKIQAGIFGQWANKNARQYFDEGYAPLKEKQIAEYVDSGVSMQEYWDYRQGLTGLDANAEKIDYIAELDLPIKARNTFANNVHDREEEVDLTNYDRFAGFEEFDFATKNPEKYEFLKANAISYKDYTADEERKEEINNVYSWVKNNPEKYELSKAVTNDVFEYKEYTSTISEFRADKDKNGNSINGTAKKKILAYINDLEIDDGAKYILIKDKYPSDDSHNYDIIDYLNERDDISREEMITILEELDFKVDAQGNITW